MKNAADEMSLRCIFSSFIVLDVLILFLITDI